MIQKYSTNRRWLQTLAASFAVLIALELIPCAFAFDPKGKREALVHWVVDGDTFQLETGERVRLIGINTPEYQPWKHHVQPYGKEASEYAKVLLNQKRVFLEEDLQKKDKYGRTLAYTYLEDGRFVNELLVEEGYAKVRYYAPNGRYYQLLKAAEQRARKAKKGLWALNRPLII